DVCSSDLTRCCGRFNRRVACIVSSDVRNRRGALAPSLRADAAASLSLVRSRRISRLAVRRLLGGTILRAGLRAARNSFVDKEDDIVMTPSHRPPFRADHVGSLLRPQSLLELRERVRAGKASPEELRSHEDECIRQAVEMQEALGLESITDGEYRRQTFHGDFLDRLEGVEFRQIFPPGGTESGGHEAPFIAVVTGPIKRPDGGVEVENFKFLRSLTTRTARQTIPSPTMLHFRGGRDAIDRRAYPELDAFFADV